MTKKDYIRIGEVLRDFKKRMNYTETGKIVVKELRPLEFLINEFSYIFEEDNEKFDEKKFREFINS